MNPAYSHLQSAVGGQCSKTGCQGCLVEGKMKVKGTQGGNFWEEMAFELGFEGQIRFEGLKMGLWEERGGAEHSGPME